jgi:2-alkyl-3-oxoalkanoate reductase
MKLLVTGASGFLGRYVVAEALRRGHGVRALVRDRGAGFPTADGLECICGDLRSRSGLVEAVSGVDAVLHLAAAKTGDLYAQYASTVVATENLLWAMTEAPVSHIVAISSLSVYDYLKPWSFTTLDEDSVLEADGFARDAYAQTKLVQERLIRSYAQEQSWRWTILRPGAIFGADNLWTARLGIQAGRWWIRLGGWAHLPLTYVENCAQAMLDVAENKSADGEIFNVVDDHLPTQRSYAALLRKYVFPRPHILPIPWLAIRLLAGSASWVNRLFFRNSAKLPGVLIPARLHARCKPLRFSNAHLKSTLGWKPRYSWRQGVLRSVREWPLKRGRRGDGLTGHLQEPNLAAELVPSVSEA